MPFSSTAIHRPSRNRPERRRSALVPLLALCLAVALLIGLPAPPLAAQLENSLSGLLKQPSKKSLTGDDTTVNDFLPPNQQQYILARLDQSRQVVVTIGGDDPDKPAIVIRADEIENARNQHLSRFLGHVSITRGPETITADRALWNDQTNTVELTGNLRIETPDFTIMAGRAVVNLDLYIAKIYEGKAYFPSRNYYVSGAILERLGERTMQIQDGTATTCDGPNPAWTIHADKLTVTEGGYATASGASFNTGRLPIVKVPWMMFPVKNERQTGFLFPAVALSSRDGLTVALPFFWATGENHDLTFTPIWRNDRGLSSTVEGRYHLEEGRGIWQMTYLDDKKPQYFDYKNTPNSQEARERYWLRAMNQWRLGDWDINLDLDLVSDPLYLAEFRGDLDGFGKSSNLFTQEFGRTVNEYLDPMRSNTFYAQRASYDSFFRGGLEYTDNLYNQNNDDTIQRLPFIQYNLVGRPLGEVADAVDSVSAPRLFLDMRYDYFSRTSNAFSLTDETGHRAFINPSLLWSAPVAGLATLQVTGDLELTMYAADGYRPSLGTPAARDAARHNSNDNRLAGSVEAALSTTFSRVFSGGPGDALATRHQITPTVIFTDVEAPDDQSDLPYWDPLDRRLSRRTVKYGLLNTFVSKSAQVDEHGANAGFNYFQFLKIGLWSSYEFTDNLDWARNPMARYLTTDYYEQGVGPVELEIEAFFNPYFSARLVSGMDGQTGNITSHDLSLKVQDPRGDSLILTYDFDSPKSAGVTTVGYDKYEEIRADLGIVLTSEWRADFSTRFDMRADRPLETHARLMYQAQCYGLGVLYSDSDNDRRVGLVVDLLGLGAINYDQTGLATPPKFFYQ